MTNQEHIDHAAYPRRIREKPDTVLECIIQDCRSAIKAMPDGPKAGYYADEIHYCAMELAKRRRAELETIPTVR